MNRTLPKALVALVGVGWIMAGGGCMAAAQASPARGPLMLVTSFGPGGIALPQGTDWNPAMLTLYDDGKRPMAQFSNERIKASMALLLFENVSGTPTAQGCREDTIGSIVKKYGKVIFKRSDRTTKLSDGTEIATTAYTLYPVEAKAGHQRNLFAFAGNATVCAEAHLSSTVDTAAEAEQLQRALSDFRPNLSYQRKPIDLFHIGQLLSKRDAGIAVPYFKAALDLMPTGPSYTTPRRLTTDQLVMALGKNGDVKGSRAVAEDAVTADPDYPINYYNLACADAEQGDAVNAKKHLQEAFDRRRNVLAGEQMPDASKDESLLKLKGDAAFWEFVLSLPKS